MANKNHAGKVILFLALAAALLLVSFSAMADIQEHVWDDGTFVEAATCSHGKIYRYTCVLPDCGATKLVEVGATDPDAHKWGDWIVDKEPTCTETGTRHRICQYVSHHTQEQTMLALGHLWDDGVITKAPTCLTPGEKTYTCQRDPSHKYTGAVDPLGHDWGDWETVKPATCTEDGEEKHVCKRDPSHVEYRTVKATGHDWGPWTVIKPATCTEDGEEHRICKKCGLEEKRPIKMLGHDWDNGTIIKEPTTTEEGEKKYVCKNDPSHEKYEKIPRKAIGGTLCAFGFRLSGYNKNKVSAPFLYDKWYMYTPFDASVDGTQTFEVVLSNAYIPGSISVTVSNGYLTVHEPQIKGNSLSYDLKFFTVLNKITDLDQYEPEQLLDRNMVFEKPYEIDVEFGGDTNLVLYLCSRVTAYFNEKWDFLKYESDAHYRILTGMYELMQADTF